MFKRIAEWWKIRFPTQESLENQGRQHVRDLFKLHGFEVMRQVLNSYNLDFSSARDRGIIREQSAYDQFYLGGLHCGRQIIQGAPEAVAIQVISRRCETSHPAYEEGLLESLREKGLLK